ncbi:hypothetical protein E2C01_077780 [Portunus trituberculatus]|uniref:Uncharacterized protein n=1 Tax=Portunus trituberculatus TaxID=210409 RepID=A0A5B7IM85_PORTR|nr:hypothetical protein [Portunus trituberculatus]
MSHSPPHLCLFSPSSFMSHLHGSLPCSLPPSLFPVLCSLSCRHSHRLPFFSPTALMSFVHAISVLNLI